MMRIRVDFSQGGMECRLCARVCAGVPKFNAEMIGVCCGYERPERASGRGGGDRFCTCGSAVPEVRFKLLSRLGAELLEFRVV
jgi:hypothetical protein